MRKSLAGSVGLLAAASLLMPWIDGRGTEAGLLHPGDANCNGVVDANDAAAVLRFIAGFEVELPCPANADVNGDDTVTSVDSALILQFEAGLIDSFAGPTSTPVNTSTPAEPTSTSPTPSIPTDVPTPSPTTTLTVPPTPSATSTPAQPTVTVTSPATATLTATPTATSTPSLEGAHAELAAFLDSMEGMTFNVVLERTDPPDLAGNRIVALNSPGGSRIDTIPAGESAATTALIEITGAKNLISCFGGPDAWSCVATKPFGQSILRTALPFTFFPASELASYSVEEIAPREVAGENSRCFEIGLPDQEFLEYCFTVDGIPVYSSPVFGTYEAVEIAREIPGDAFDPPAAVE